MDMFKKLKDKIAEEVKQSPLKFQTSVQQLTRAVSTDSIHGNSVNEEIYFDNNMIKDERNMLTSNKTNSAFGNDNSFISVDLRSPTSPLENRRSSSSSSITYEIFPKYECSLNRSSLTSDLESNSEFDDGNSVQQFSNISKETLYEKYCIMLQKYHKYRGRFVDLKKYCQELQKENTKAKHILTETQDNALRRITELREQCSLEQKAKAHLEDALRNELEEKDHIIKTLNTKIELLKSGKNYDRTEVELPKSEKTQRFSSIEIENMREKIKNFESLLNKAKDAITNKNSQIYDLNLKIESDKKYYESELKSYNQRITKFQNDIDVMKRREEDALLTLAENKLTVHKELEAKEMQIKNLENKIVDYEKELKIFKSRENQINEDKETLTIRDELGELEKSNSIAGLSSNKENVIKQLKDELVTFKNELHTLTVVKNKESAALLEKDKLIEKYKTSNNELNNSCLKLQSDFEILNEKNENYFRELKHLTDKIAEKEQLINELRNQSENKEKFYKEANYLSDSLNSEIVRLNESLEQTKTSLNEKMFENKMLNDTINELKIQFNKSNHELQDEKINFQNKDKINLSEICKNSEELIQIQTNLQNIHHTIMKYEKKLYLLNEQVKDKNQQLPQFSGHKDELLANEAEMAKNEFKITKDRLSQISDLVEYLRHKNESLTLQKETLRTEVEHWKKISEKNILLTDEFKIRYQSYIDTCYDLMAFCEEIKPIPKQLNQYKNKIQHLLSTNEILTSECKTLASSKLEWENESHRLLKEIDKLNNILQEDKNKIKELKCDNEKLKMSLTNALNEIRNRMICTQKNFVRFKIECNQSLNLFQQYYQKCVLQITQSVGVEQKRINDLGKAFAELSHENDIIKSKNVCIQQDIQEFILEIDQLKTTVQNYEKIKNEDANGYEKRLQDVEKNYQEEIERVTRDYELQFAQKVADNEKLANRLFQRDNREDIFINEETKHIIRSMQEELTAKNQAFEKLLEEHRDDIQKFNNERSELSENHCNELKKVDKKWRSYLDTKIAKLEEKHKEEINELNAEWSADRELGENNFKSKNITENQFLEKITKYNEDAEMLQKQVQILSKELNTYKNLQRNELIDIDLANIADNNIYSSVEYCTEMEYLRNILFEYMMGNQPLVLAKVLAAVVKFDDCQTKQILQREEHKLTLLGQLGFD